MGKQNVRCAYFMNSSVRVDHNKHGIAYLTTDKRKRTYARHVICHPKNMPILAMPSERCWLNIRINIRKDQRKDSTCPASRVTRIGSAFPIYFVLAGFKGVVVRDHGKCVARIVAAANRIRV